MILAQMFGSSALVWDGMDMLPASLGPKLKSKSKSRENVLAVGDSVEGARDAAGALSLVSIGPRRTPLARAGGEGGEAQIVAADAERAGIVSSAGGAPAPPGPRGPRAAPAHP